MEPFRTITLSLLLGVGVTVQAEALRIPSPNEAWAMIEALEEAKEVDAIIRRLDLKATIAVAQWTWSQPDQSVLIRLLPSRPKAATLSPLSPTAVAPASSGSATVAPSDEFPARPTRSIHLHVTVYDHSLSEITWREESGPTWKAWSNVDFNYLNGFNAFSDEHHDWLTFLSVDNQVTANSTNHLMRQPIVFASAEPDYVVVAGEGAGVPTALHEELEALHRHYAENELRLIAGHERNRVLDEARERWRAANPPQPREVVINFWRVR